MLIRKLDKRCPIMFKNITKITVHTDAKLYMNGIILFWDRIF